MASPSWPTRSTASTPANPMLQKQRGLQMQASLVCRDPVCLTGQRQLLGFADGNGAGLERLRQLPGQLYGQ